MLCTGACNMACGMRSVSRAAPVARAEETESRECTAQGIIQQSWHRKRVPCTACMLHPVSVSSQTFTSARTQQPRAAFMCMSTHQGVPWRPTLPYTTQSAPQLSPQSLQALVASRPPSPPSWHVAQIPPLLQDALVAARPWARGLPRIQAPSYHSDHHRFRPAGETRHQPHQPQSLHHLPPTPDPSLFLRHPRPHHQVAAMQGLPLPRSPRVPPDSSTSCAREAPDHRIACCCT